MKVDEYHGTVIRIENRYAVLSLDSGEEKPVLLSALPSEFQVGERLCFRNDHWITEKQAEKKQKGRIRTLRAMLKGE